MMFPEKNHVVLDLLINHTAFMSHVVYVVLMLVSLFALKLSIKSLRIPELFIEVPETGGKKIG